MANEVVLFVCIGKVAAYVATPSRISRASPLLASPYKANPDPNCSVSQVRDDNGERFRGLSSLTLPNYHFTHHKIDLTLFRVTMLVPAKLTSKVLLGTPSRSPAVPNQDGNLALYTTSTHTFGKGTVSELRVMMLETGSSHLVSGSDSVHDANWLGDGTNVILFLEDGEAGITHLKLVDADDLCFGINPVLVGVFPAPVQGLRVKPSGGGRLAIAVVGLAGEDGELFNEKTAEKKASTGQVYDNFRVRVVSVFCPPGSSYPINIC